MYVYRIANKKYKDTTLSGIGAEKVGGRWNEVGTRAVYCSENIALALLEYYVHSDNIALLPKSILLAKIFIPDHFELLTLAPLPLDWNVYPYTPASTKPFSILAKNNGFLGLKVPSTVIPLENNYVLNPLFKDFGKVEIVEFIEMEIDIRLKQK